MKHIVSFSGGKDSTLMLLMMLEKDMPVDDIIFADTGMEFKELYEYIERIEGAIGRKITKLKPIKTWDDIFLDQN
jgi:3'-phosphoadenosine 5'-phosphosulfate sulfotransferase (PAPS reductase)/FAD synthetase